MPGLGHWRVVIAVEVGQEIGDQGLQIRVAADLTIEIREQLSRLVPKALELRSIQAAPFHAVHHGDGSDLELDSVPVHGGPS